jgi:hypothetical protein
MRPIAAIALILGLCSACDPKSGDSANSQNSGGAHVPLTKAPDGRPIVRAIKEHLGPKYPVSDKARFTMAFTDLNGDGKDEAVVYLVDPSFAVRAVA